MGVCFEMEDGEKSVMDLAKELSEASRTKGKVSFKISYTSTDGNLDIHKRFQKFCFDHSNNEYLAGIGKLLDYAGFVGYLMELEQRVDALEKSSVKVKSEEVKKEEVNFKTF